MRPTAAERGRSGLVMLLTVGFRLALAFLVIADVFRFAVTFAEIGVGVTVSGSDAATSCTSGSTVALPLGRLALQLLEQLLLSFQLLLQSSSLVAG